MAIWTKYSQTMDTSNTYVKYRIKAVLNSQSIDNNSSNLTISIQVWRTNTGYTTYGSGTAYCKINGVTYSAAITSSDLFTYNSYTEVFSKTLNITHDPDGQKNLALEAYLVHSQFSTSWQFWSGGLDLNAIPRTSVPTLSASSGYFGNAVTVYTNRASSSFTHTLKYKFNGGSESTIATSVGSSYAWTVPTSLMNNIPSSTKATITFVLYTYYGGTVIGSKTINFTANVPSSVIPTCGLSISAVDAFNGYALTSKSKAYLLITSPSGSYGSTIVGYHIEGPGLNVNSVNGTSSVFTTAGTKTYTCYVIDSRGRVSTTHSASLTVYTYTPPQLTLTAYRALEDGTRDDIFGTYIYVYAHADMMALYSNDIDYGTLKIGGSTVASGNNEFDATYGPYSISGTYTVEFTFKDLIGQEQTRTFVITPGAVPIVLASDRRGIGIGGYEDSEDDVIKSYWKYKGTDIEITGNLEVGEINTETNAKPLVFTRYAGSDQKLEIGVNDSSAVLKVTQDESVANFAFQLEATDTESGGGAAANSTEILFSTGPGGGEIKVDGNPVVDSGSNANGYYVRYYDGTQICWGSYHCATTLENTWGSGVFTSGFFSTGRSWPAAFSVVPIISLNPDSTGHYTGLSVSNRYPTTTALGEIEIFRGDEQTTARDFKIDFIAVGRWY